MLHANPVDRESALCVHADGDRNEPLDEPCTPHTSILPSTLRHLVILPSRLPLRFPPHPVSGLAFVQFGGKLTDIVATNLKQQVQEQMTVALENINSYFEVNPDLLLSVLGISMDDLDEKVVWV